MLDEKIPNTNSEKLLYEVKEKECNKIVSNIKKDSYVIALDLTRKAIFFRRLF